MLKNTRSNQYTLSDAKLILSRHPVSEMRQVLVISESHTIARLIEIARRKSLHKIALPNHAVRQSLFCPCAIPQFDPLCSSSSPPTNNPSCRLCLTLFNFRNTTRSDFKFYADRLIRLVIEESLNQLPYSDCSVVTPTGAIYDGLKYRSGNCGVSIVRSGEAMEQVTFYGNSRE